MMNKIRNWQGETVGSLVVREYAGSRAESFSVRALWRCVCACGSVVVISSSELQRKRRAGRQGACSRACPSAQRRVKGP